jgi:hypothetical protein
MEMLPILLMPRCITSRHTPNDAATAPKWITPLSIALVTNVVCVTNPSQTVMYASSITKTPTRSTALHTMMTDHATTIVVDAVANVTMIVEDPLTVLQVIIAVTDPDQETLPVAETAARDQEIVARDPETIVETAVTDLVAMRDLTVAMMNALQLLLVLTVQPRSCLIQEEVDSYRRLWLQLFYLQLDNCRSYYVY